MIDAEKIQRGDILAPGESVVWQGAPDLRSLMLRVFHLRAILAYFAALLAYNAYQAWAQEMPMRRAMTASIPLFVLCALAFCIFGLIAYATMRTTRYTITNRRVILKFGIAMPATLSMPFSRIAKVAVSINADHTGDIALQMKPGNQIGYLKIWPHARPWRLAKAEPALRCVAKGAVVSALLTRTINAAMASAHTGQPGSAPASVANEMEKPPLDLLRA